MTTQPAQLPSIPVDSAPPVKSTRKRRWLRWVISIPLLVLGLVLIVMAYLPVPEDKPLPLAEQGGGARQEGGAINGLQGAWPEISAPDPQQAALGKLLFYDPVLSANDDLACASCHHPDMGFSDGKPVSVGAHGENLRRNAPSLWDVAYATSLFWDGRAKSLEDQMMTPLTNENEMAANPEQLVAQLATIPAYQQAFSTAFSDGLNITNISVAIASFERTLVTHNSPFDKFAAGDFNALTPAQRRGFNVFRSAQTRCYECHTWPTFSNYTFNVLGVPDTNPLKPDLGQVEIVNGPDSTRAFRTPSLRNVALSAPYMHNGVFSTLEEVVEFYAKGGGPAFGVKVAPDEFLQGFTLSDQQKSDLVAFMYALTDEPSNLISIPTAVPSGLAVVQHMENAARTVVQQSEAVITSAPVAREPQIITVHVGETIQAGVDRAQPGDTVMVEPGVYHETVYVDNPKITIKGIINGDERPWLDGEKKLSDGFNTTGDDFTLEDFGVRNYIGNGVLTTRTERVVS